jgi:phosphate:Na+ symporter
VGRLPGIDRLAAETPRQIANVHTFFNVVNAVLFVGFTTQIARLAEWLIPDRPIPPEKAMLPKFLDDDLLKTPAVALEAARQEVRRLGKQVRKMVSGVMPTAISGTRQELEAVVAMDKVVDARHLAIIDFLGQISLGNLSKKQSKQLMQLADISNSLEYIGDRIATGLVTSAQKRIDEDVRVSEQTAEILTDYHQMVSTTLDDAMRAVVNQDAELANNVRKRKKNVKQMMRDISAHGMDRLTADEPNRLKTYAREMEVVEILDGIFNVARRIAQTQK